MQWKDEEAEVILTVEMYVCTRLSAGALLADRLQHNTYIKYIMTACFLGLMVCLLSVCSTKRGMVGG